MNRISQSIQTEFLPFLDHQIEHLRQVRRFLDQFRAALIRKDVDELQQIQRDLAQEADRRGELDCRLESLRRRFAGLLACTPQQVCASKLAQAADPPTGERLRQKQRQTRELVTDVKDAHLATELLLRECARVNRSMLEALMGRPAPAPVYDARGRTAWQPATGLMNMKL